MILSAAITAVIGVTIICAVILRRLGQVHALVNSRYTDVSTRLDMALEQIEDLKSERQIAREGQAGDPQNRGY